jgi:hypothetical protein
LVASRPNAAHCKDLEAVYMTPLTRDHSLWFADSVEFLIA